MPPGFLGTRANLLVDLVLIFNLAAPVWAYWAAKKARTAQYQTHARLQLALIAVMFCCLFSLEGYIRISGGSGSLIVGSPYAGTTLLRAVFIAHIGPAAVTYLLWLVLVIVSMRRRSSRLPGDFSRRHRFYGLAIMAGLVWIAISAIAVYLLGFTLTA